MDWPAFQTWAFPGAIGALAIIVGYVGRSLLEKQNTIEAMLRTELRAMDVRISVIESQLGLRDRYE